MWASTAATARSQGSTPVTTTRALADDGDAGAIHAEERQAAQGQAQVGADEGAQGDQPLEVQLSHVASERPRQ